MIEWLNNFGGEVIDSELSQSYNIDGYKFETDANLCEEKRNYNIEDIAKLECDRLHALSNLF